jgi:hypothetical protein
MALGARAHLGDVVERDGHDDEHDVRLVRGAGVRAILAPPPCAFSTEDH